MNKLDELSALAVLDQMIKNLVYLDATSGEIDSCPIDEIDCYNDDGTLDIDRYEQFCESQDNEEFARRYLLALSMFVCALGEEDHEEDNIQRGQHERMEQGRRPKRKRTTRNKFFVDPTSGHLRPMTPKLSLWWLIYIQDPKPDCAQWSRTFRNRFRLPYESFIDLLHMIVNDNNEESNRKIFRRWTGRQQQNGITNIVAPPGKVASPIELLLLGSLRYLGRGFTFDDLEETTFIGRDVHRSFFHSFVEFGEKKLFPMFVQLPQSVEALKECEHAYRIAGFPGCIGSTDATHIPLERVAFTIRQAHLGFKMSGTTRTYNLTVNHKREILHSTGGHPGRWNDKTLARYDSFMDTLRRGGFDDKMSFELSDVQGRTKTVKGAYVLVDNGYLEWSTTVPPFKDSSNRSEIRFSQWLESLRKDVECTFGILKSRWRILKTGIRLHNTETADRVWLTCCALHNMLLHVDGLSEGWQTGVPSYWEQEGNGFLEYDDMPQAIRRLLGTPAMQSTGNNDAATTTMDEILQMDQSGIGYRPSSSASIGIDEDDNINDDGGNNNADDTNQHQSRGATDDVVPSVSMFTLKQFRSMLVENFNVLFVDQQVTWPKRLPIQPRNIPMTTI